MKKYYLIIVMVVCGSLLQAQTPSGKRPGGPIIDIEPPALTTSTNPEFDLKLLSVDQSSVTSGIIYERVMQLANLYNYNKTTTFNTANFDYFKQAFSEMHRASNGTKFLPMLNFKDLASSKVRSNEVNLAILNTQFNILNYNMDAPDQGGLILDAITKKFQQIRGKAPFYMMQTTVIAPAKDVVSGTSVVYKIRNDLYFKNGNKVIKTLIADFGDGMNRTLIDNQTLIAQEVIVSYSSSGEKVSAFTITFTDNSTLTTYGKIYFNSESSLYEKKVTECNAYEPKQSFHLETDELFKGYEPTDPSIKVQIDYRVFYANMDRKIRKPIIIVDGFDPGDKRRIEDCDCQYDVENCGGKEGNITNGIFDPKKHRSMVDVMEYNIKDLSTNKDSSTNVLPLLIKEGYDVIMVNHPTYTDTNTGAEIDGGAYYVESNAMALIKLIKQVNDDVKNNNSSAKLAIVGPSMGGQISRYALAFMEKRYAETNDSSWLHNTYLWISVDSPHLGANVPMGDQALLNLVRGESEGAREFYEKHLRSPAAQQLLIESHREGLEWGITNISFNPGSLFPTFTYGWKSNYNTVDQNYLNAQTISQ
jgi:Putative serine esterase (DUF676)